MTARSNSKSQLLTDRVFDLLKERLSPGSKPGESFNEALMARRFNASRTPIREACNQLRNAGLLARHSEQRATSVSPITIKDVLDVYQLRLVVEPVCAEFAARSLNQGEVAELEAMLQPEKGASGKMKPHLGSAIPINELFTFVCARPDQERPHNVVDRFAPPGGGEDGLCPDAFVSHRVDRTCGNHGGSQETFVDESGTKQCIVTYNSARNACLRSFATRDWLSRRFPLVGGL